jgi:hypothetical protein
VQQIVTEYQKTGSGETVQESNIALKEETFAESAAPVQRVTTTEKAAHSAMNRLWILLFFHIAPAAVIGYAIGFLHLEGAALIAAYGIGALLCLAIYAVVSRWMEVWGRSRLEKKFQAKLNSEGFSSATHEGRLIGLSPDPTPRFYVANCNWDNGYLSLACDGIYFVGDQVRFKLGRGQIRDIRLAAGITHWSPVQRVYIDWWDETRAAVRTFNLAPLRPCSFWNLQKEAVGLAEWLRAWMTDPGNFPQPTAALAALQAPSLGEVTSRSLKSLNTVGRAFQLAFWIVLLAILSCTFFGAPTVYVCAVVLLLRLYEHVPYWLAKEPAVPAGKAVVKAAGS